MVILTMMKDSTAQSIFVFSLVAFVDAEITLRLSDAAVVYGQSFSLICYTAVDRSSQFASFYRSLSRDDFTSVVAAISYKGPSSCQASTSSSPNYNYSCNNNGKEITLTVPADNLNEHNTYWKCINPGGPILANNNIVPIFVNVPVSLVQISPAGSLTLREFESRTLTCTTSFCRPAAVISWWKNDVDITNITNSSTHDQNTTTGIIAYRGNRLDNGHTILCKAWNGYGNQQTSQPIILDIRYSPANPIIGTYTNGSVFSMIETARYTLTCIVTGGNPLAYLSWNCFGFSGSSIVVNQSVISTITPTVNRTQDRQLCECVSTQEIQGIMIVFVVIRVLYPPCLTPFTSPAKVIEGHPLELMCKADGSPPPKLIWSPLGDDSLNQSRLWYRNITRSNHGTHTCTATNTMQPTTGNPVTQSDSEGLVIDVLYSPNVTSFMLPRKVIEEDPLEVECLADGNPPPQLTWSPLGEDAVDQSRLYYHSISRRNHGNYTCTAINTMQPTTGGPVTQSNSKWLFIDVLYKTSVSAFTVKFNNNLIMENASLELYCQVDSNPYSDIFLYHEDNFQLKKEDTLKLNYTKTAGCLDAGKYTCCANNSIRNGSSVSSDLQIMVACDPRLDLRKNVSTVYYTGLNSNVTLEVFVIAYPEPTNITWYHRENETDMWQRVPSQPASSGGLFSRMLIQITSTRDFGYYMVTMDNYLGNFSHTYKIIPEMVPVTFLGGDTSTWFTVAGISAGIGVIVILAIVLIILKRRDYNINTLLQLCRKPIKDPVYANPVTVCTPAEGDYEALQSNRNGGSLYQELSDIKHCADANYNFRNATNTTEKHQTYVTGKETSDTSMDQRNLLKGENKIYENTRVQK